MNRQSKHAWQHAKQSQTGILVMQGRYVLVSNVNHPLDSSTQWFL